MVGRAFKRLQIRDYGRNLVVLPEGSDIWTARAHVKRGGLSFFRVWSEHMCPRAPCSFPLQKLGKGLVFKRGLLGSGRPCSLASSPIEFVEAAICAGGNSDGPPEGG
jgi:hypothetical protein